ncbi:hypothetical protein K7X08_023076 [Anisodus acutangulus]|uniref:Uncharacterized protein n=1 Tax=Anisodus acutangulus TaxID=402998 RepID=A0A9Q1MBU4_9SOLA|nr:hypothetical protein K7X08_023076 [Anisodus acutangulus]
MLLFCQFFYYSYVQLLPLPIFLLIIRIFPADPNNNNVTISIKINLLLPNPPRKFPPDLGILQPLGVGDNSAVQVSL